MGLGRRHPGDRLLLGRRGGLLHDLRKVGDGPGGGRRDRLGRGPLLRLFAIGARGLKGCSTPAGPAPQTGAASLMGRNKNSLPGPDGRSHARPAAAPKASGDLQGRQKGQGRKRQRGADQHLFGFGAGEQGTRSPCPLSTSSHRAFNARMNPLSGSIYIRTQSPARSEGFFEV